MENMMELEDMMYSIRCQECPEGFPVVVGPQNSLEELTIKGQSVSEKIFFIHTTSGVGTFFDLVRTN